MASDWTFEWVRSWDEVWRPDFLSSWISWIERSMNAHVFYEPCLVRAWFESYCQLRRIEPRFAIARNRHGGHAFLPLVLDHRGLKEAWLRIIQPVGSNEFDYHDPVFVDGDPQRPCEGFWRALRDDLARWGREASLVQLPRVREPCTSGFGLFRSAESAPYLDLSRFASYEELLCALPAKSRQDVRRKQRKLDKLGPLTLRVFGEVDTASALDGLADLLAEHARKWPQSYKAPGFHHRVLRYAQERGVLHFSVLETGGQPASWHLGFLHHRRFYWYFPAFAPEVAEFSPGMVHVALLVERAFRHDAQVFDFLRGEEAYKRRWANGTVSLCSWRQRLSGLEAVSREALRAVFRRAGRAIRKAVKGA